MTPRWLRSPSDPTPEELKARAAAAPPDLEYLSDLRRFGYRPNTEMLARGWERFRNAWETSQAGREHLELPGLRVIVFDKRDYPRPVYDPTTGKQVTPLTYVSKNKRNAYDHATGKCIVIDIDEEELELASFTIGFGYDDGSELRYLRGSAETEAEAMQRGSAVTLAFEEAGHVPRPWVWPDKSPRALAYQKLGDGYGDRLRRDPAFEVNLDRETAAWRERRWREKAAERIWDAEQKRS